MKRNVKKWMALLLACAVMVLPTATVVAAEPTDEPTAAQAADGTEGQPTDEPVAAPAADGQQTAPQAEPTDGGTQQTAPDKTADENTPQAEPNAAADGSTPQTEPDKTADETTPQAEPDKTADETAPQADESATDLDAAGQKGEVTEPITKEDKPFLALGANLSAEQQAVVLGLLGINPAELGDYDVIYITNEEEHQYLGNYVSADKIGTRALSSVLIVKREQGHGINISTKNISYCTIGMYKNALITAGITDADIIVAGPTPISGTAALVGAMKAYSSMTGEVVTEESMDTALNELVLTGDLADAVGDSEKAEELIAYLKQEILSRDLSDENDIRAAINEACEKFDVTLSEDEVNQIVSLLKKIGQLDLDIDSITKQAQDLYDKLSKIDAGGFFSKIVDFFGKIADFFKGLFS